MKTRQELLTSTTIDHIHRVDLRVTDVDRALEFYRDVVGLEVVSQDETSAALGSPGGEVILGLDADGVTEPADPRATGLFHVAIRFPTRSSLGDVLARLVDAGIEIGAGDHLVSEALYVDDPDGNGIELYWDRPADRWPPPTEDAAIPMATLAVDLQGVMNEGEGQVAVGRRAAQGTDIGHVHLQTAEIDRTVAFYRDALGFDLTGHLGGQAAFFSSNAYHHHIGANVWRSRGGHLASRSSAGLTRIVFAVADPSASKRLGELGQRSADGVIVNDPDGIELVFVPS